MTSRTDDGHGTLLRDSPEPRYRTARGAVPSDSSLHTLDTIGALLALAIILGPLTAGAFFVPY